MPAGEILLINLKKQLPHARTYEEYLHIQDCIIKCEEAMMWKNKKQIEEEAIIQAEINSMLQETYVAA